MFKSKRIFSQYGNMPWTKCIIYIIDVSVSVQLLKHITSLIVKNSIVSNSNTISRIIDIIYFQRSGSENQLLALSTSKLVFCLGYFGSNDAPLCISIIIL